MNYELLQGDCIKVMRTLPAGSVQMCCTSPPYLNLRSYLPDDHPDKALEIGTEQSVEEYVCKMVEVFREVRRLLHPSGVLFLNIGDSYNGSGGAGGDYNEGGLKEGQPKYSGARLKGLKPKDLIGVPWEVAFALRADGWYLRQELIWHKLAPMPESVTDRCTKAHEQVFLLAKSREYFFDATAIMEPVAREWGENNIGPNNRKSTGILEGKVLGRETDPHGGLAKTLPNPNGRNKRSVWTLGPESFSSTTQTSRLQRVEPYEVSDDTICKVSASCPVHAGRFDWASSESYDVRVDELFSRTGRKRARRAPTPTFGSAQTVQRRGAETVGGSSDLPHPPYSLFATDHNTQSHRTAHDPATNLPNTAFVQTLDRTGDTQAQLDPAVPILSKPSSNIGSDDSVSIEATQPASRNIHTDTVLVSSVAYVVPPECTCSFYHEITEETSHYAVMPTKLVEPCILAGSSARGCCSKCYAPWERVVEEERTNYISRPDRQVATGGAINGGVGKNFPDTKRTTTGWQPTCTCNADVIPSTVLDPFCGSGTTLAVALKFGRRAIGIDLDERNMVLVHDRIARMQPMLFEVTP